jgi:hypothetical protein
MKRYVIFAIGGAILVVAILVGSWGYKITSNRLQAERFFTEALRLEIGKASADDALALVKSTGRRTDGGFVRCLSGAADCVGTVYFENYSKNSWPFRLHVATPMAFLCRFDVENHKLVARSFEIVHAEGANTGAFVREAGTTQLWPSEVQRVPQEKYFKISLGYPSGYSGVLVTPDAPADLRKLAYNLNFSCLSRLRGCKAAEEMLPTLNRKDLYWGQNPWVHQEKGD